MYLLLTTVMKIHQVPKRILEVSVCGRRGEPWGRCSVVRIHSALWKKLGWYYLFHQSTVDKPDNLKRRELHGGGEAEQGRLHVGEEEEHGGGHGGGGGADGDPHRGGEGRPPPLRLRLAGWWVWLERWVWWV